VQVWSFQARGDHKAKGSAMVTRFNYSRFSRIKIDCKETTIINNKKISIICNLIQMKLGNTKKNSNISFLLQTQQSFADGNE
jgi:hypothetical protein